MQKVSASEIVTPDATSGRGPGVVKLVASPNPIPEMRMAVMRVNSGGKTINVNIIQEAGDQVFVMPEFDFLVLNFSWNEDDGVGLDTATCFVDTGIQDVDGKFVGWSENSCTTQDSIGEYLIYNGDNVQSGKEVVLIDMKTLLDREDIDISDTDVEVAVYGNWRETKGIGNVKVSFKAYVGGEMIKEDSDFVNNGGEESYSGSITVNIDSVGENNYQNIIGLYAKIGSIIYNKEKRDCVVIIG